MNKTDNFIEHNIEWNDKKISRLWDYYSRTHPYCDVYFSKVFGRHILRHSALLLNEPLDVLDFGCGPGFIWDHLIQLNSCWQYTALDFSSYSVNTVIEKANGHKNFRGAHHVNSLPVSLPDSHFNVVLLLEVVEHLNDSYLEGTLSEISRLLKRGGICVISTPNNEDLSRSTKFCPDCGAIFHEWQHIRTWDVNSLSTRVKQHGLNLRLSKTLDFTTQGFTPRAVFRKIKLKARQLLMSDSCSPHLLAVFQKA